MLGFPKIMNRLAKITIGEHEIREGPGSHNRRPARHRLVNEAVAALLLSHAGDCSMIGNAGGIIIAKELYVSAEREWRQFSTGCHDDR